MTEKEMFASLVHAQNELAIIKSMVKGDCRFCKYRHDCSLGYKYDCKNGEQWEYELFINYRQEDN